jgi:acetyl-CoA synthetase
VIVDDEGSETLPGEPGELAVDTSQSPLFWFRGYHNDPERTAERFTADRRYYLTGDGAYQDETGAFYFAARTDDVITSSGYRIGPFEVENAILTHPAVAEVAVIGVPDELRGEAVTAFIVPSGTVASRPDLAAEIQQHVQSTLAKHLYPRHVIIVDELPKTPSSKIQRTQLRKLWAEGAFDDQVPG